MVLSRSQQVFGGIRRFQKVRLVSADLGRSWWVLAGLVWTWGILEVFGMS